MQVMVVTRSDTVKAFFAPLKELQTVDLVFRCDFPSGNQAADLIYLDLSGLKIEKAKKLIYRAHSRNDMLYGLIDPDQLIEDPATYMHFGACDYLGSSLLEGSFQPRRWERLLFSLDMNTEETVYDPKIALNWDSVVSGGEYEFLMLYLCLDDASLWKNRLGLNSYKQLIQHFTSEMNRDFSQIEGREWIWSEDEGVILFPLGRDPGRPLMTCFRMNLNKQILAVEKFDSKGITYRMVLHRGTCPYYEAGQTGEIISDTINTLYHLGQKYCSKDTFCITDSILTHVPEGLEGFLEEKGLFEGRKLYRVRSPFSID